MTKFYTSDLHLNHANVIRYCNRPFKHVGEMFDTIKTNWNNVVGPNDEVFILGDVGFYRDDEVMINEVSQLNGQKYLIYGNHDKNIRRNKKLQSLFGWCRDMVEIHDDDTSIVLSHYGMRVWNKSHHGALHFYGHSHGTLPGDSQSCDVGVDVWNFTPVTLQEIKVYLATLPSRMTVDHHRKENHV